MRSIRVTQPTSNDQIHRRQPIRRMPRRLLAFGLGLAAAGTMLAASFGPSVLAQTVPVPVTVVSPAQATLSSPAPATTIGDTTALQSLTVAETEGPYFKANSPEATSLLQDGMQGTVLTITGQVLGPDGTPVANALLDFWQANASGSYDNTGYTLRGHQYTDANGYYTVTTVEPGLYPGRTEHIHVKVQAPNGPVLTTQLFFPGVARNSQDSIFDPSLVLSTQTNPDSSQSATFNFVVRTA
jgi:protocatechuate 3,4-dioxygenase beta subunit